MPESTVPITKVQIGHVIGPGGATIKSIQEKTGAKLEIDNSGPAVKITAEEQSQVDAAVAAVKEIVANQENPDYEGPEGARLRKEANALGDKRSKLYDEATAKRNAGDHEAANKLAAEAKQAGEDMETRNREAAAAIAKHNNEDKGKGENYFDMHGLREEEAMEMLKIRTAALEAKPAGTVTDFEVIPGAGHHSAPGAQKLKGATEAYFKERGFSYESVSAGSFMVKVPGTGASSVSAPTTEPPVDEAPVASANDVSAATGTEPDAAGAAAVASTVDVVDMSPEESVLAAAGQAASPPAVPASGENTSPKVEGTQASEQTEEDTHTRGGAAQIAEEEAAQEQQEAEEPVIEAVEPEPVAPEAPVASTQVDDPSQGPEDALCGTVGGEGSFNGRSSTRVFIHMPPEVRERLSRTREDRSAGRSAEQPAVPTSQPEDTTAEFEKAAIEDDNTVEDASGPATISGAHLITLSADETASPEAPADVIPTEAAAENSAEVVEENPAPTNGSVANDSANLTIAHKAELVETEDNKEASAVLARSGRIDEDGARSPRTLADSQADQAGDHLTQAENNEPKEEEKASFDGLETSQNASQNGDAHPEEAKDANDGASAGAEAKSDKKKSKKEKDKAGCCSTM